MKTILVTGGTDGIGKGIALHFLKKGYRVIVVGSTLAKGEAFYNEAKQYGASERAFYIQANLSLIQENKRVIEEIRNRFQSLDIVVFCAAKYNQEYTETKEGYEFTFALAYLSRFLLSYGLKECLEQSNNPIILNVCAPGMKGEVNWNDLHNKNNYTRQRVMYHGSRLNDLLGVAFAHNDTVKKIKYILYNPWAVQTTSMMEVFKNPILKLMYKIIGKPVEKAILPAIDLINNPPTVSLTAYKEYKKINLKMDTFNKENALKLYALTIDLIKRGSL